MKIFKKIIAKLYFWYPYKKEIFSLNKKLMFDKHDLALITISFNNSDILKLQYEYIKKNLIDDFIYMIADNSNNNNESEKIALFAKINNLVYIKLPPNPYSNIDPSKSHGLALNFICKKILKINSFKYVGFIDQDIFPISKTSVTKNINKLPYYGLVQNNNNRYYLWAGFCFFSKKFLSVNKIDFMPTEGLDTGGGNYKIYSKEFLLKTSVKHHYTKIKTGEIIENPYEGMQNDSIEFIDDWMHIMNSSSWLSTYNKKEKIDFVNNMIR